MDAVKKGLAGVMLGCATCAALLGLPASADPAPQQADAGIQDLKQLNLEDLAQLEVSIVSKRPEQLGQTPAAVFVMTAEDIRRSGVTTIAEALRMVPGLNVARLGTSDWAISARGFNSQLANKLLVLIDGRSVYTPLFSGVFWDAQDIPVETIERIEVIRGPGAASWGANAVNGVINVITKSTLERPDRTLRLSGGDQQQVASLQLGNEVGARGGLRLHAKVHDRDNMRGDGEDGTWSGGRVGFRTDWQLTENDELTVQGEIYSEDAYPTDLRGSHLLGRWERRHGNGGVSTAQFYFDHVELENAILDEDQDTFDAEYRYRTMLAERHNLVMGAGWRSNTSVIDPGPVSTIIERRRTDHLVSMFVQDDVQINDRWYATLGTRLEDNAYTGFEVQPSARVRYLAGSRSTLWAAVSRAVRTPSRAEHDVGFESNVAPPSPETSGLPLVMRITADRSMVSEELMAYEFGWRWRGASRLAVDLALFHNHYDKLRTVDVDPTPPVFDPLPTPRLVVNGSAGNALEGTTTGGELLLDWQPRRFWRLQSALSIVDVQLTPLPASMDPVAEQPEGESPEYQLSVRSLMDLPANTELDVWARWVDELPAYGIESYATLDVRLGFRPTPELRLALTGRNLVDEPRQEFGDIALINGRSALVQREVLLTLDWLF